MPPRTRRPWSIILPSQDVLEGLSQAERLKVIRRLNVRLDQREAVFILTCVVLSLIGVAVVLFIGPLAGWFQSLGMGRTVSHVIAGISISVATVIVGYAIGYCLLWSLVKQSYRQALRDVGRDVCVNCGYWLRGLNVIVKQCPECGAKRETMANMGSENA